MMHVLIKLGARLDGMFVSSLICRRVFELLEMTSSSARALFGRETALHYGIFVICSITIFLFLKRISSICSIISGAEE